MALFSKSSAQHAQALPMEQALQTQQHEIRGRLLARYWQTQTQDKGKRRVHYLSMEFLMGRALQNAIAAFGEEKKWQDYTAQAGISLAKLINAEPDAGLGNGGLGRLAACFLDSMAQCGISGFGYGLRYEYGMFAQSLNNGRQMEMPDDWLKNGAPWEIVRPDFTYPVHFGGHVVTSNYNAHQAVWHADETVIATAHDFVVPAHGQQHSVTLRQWRAHSDTPIDYPLFSRGEHIGAVHKRLHDERINWFLYPDDSTPAGRELRLRQEYFLVSASLQDLIARHMAEHQDIRTLAEHNAIQLNDTHPALAVPELLRLLLDEHGLSWATACALAGQTLNYTNHTLMPEALETWPVALMEKLLPRHLGLIYNLNEDFLNTVRAQFPDDDAMARRVSLIDEHGERRVRMAHTAIVLSHRVNGVSALHSQLMTDTIFADFAKVFPQRFCNVTNGVTHRRWLVQCNPALAEVLDGAIGQGWRQDLNHLKKLAETRTLTDKTLKSLMQAKQANKNAVASWLQQSTGIRINPESMFDIHIKRIHEYKRQLLNIVQVVARYFAICENPDAPWQPKTVLFAGKAASAYHTAKMIIQLIHDVGTVIHADERMRDRLKVIFLPNYSVSLAERLIPSADLSEQISLAGTEASGTGNMKFAMNGALTMGTWDGANIEMAEHIGAEHLFIFGLREEAVRVHKQNGFYPAAHIQASPRLEAVISAIRDGVFSPNEPNRYRALMDGILHHDSFMLSADFDDYWRAQSEADTLYHERMVWAKKAALNIAGMGFFSSDRAIRQYAQSIWTIDSATIA